MGKDPVDAADLAMLVRVVDAGGVTRAAEVMYVSQPAVTHRLRRLERVLGARLVERQGRRLALTDAGQAILPLARQALRTVPFLADTIVLVAAPSHPLAGRRVSPKELEQTRLLLREDGSATRAMALSALARCGVDTDVAVGFGSNAAVRTAVLAGYGVAALSRAVVGDDLEQGRLKLVRPQDWRCRRRFYIIRRRDRRLTTAEEILLKFVHQEE